MIGRILTFAITSGLAKKAWDHYHEGRRRPPEDITNVVARPQALQSRQRVGRKAVARRRSEGPAA